MSTPRLGPVILLLLSACAGWDSSTPSYSQPPVEEPVPSHYAPPPPDVPEPAEPAEPEPPEPPEPPASPAPGDHVAIASVQLLGDCPDPTPASGSAGQSGKASASDQRAASKLVGPEFNANFGPFILEVDVSIDGRRQTVRSPEFGRIDTHMRVT